MDADVVPGSVTVWTVTLNDQRRITWALVRLRLRAWTHWVLALATPVLLAGAFWLGELLDRDQGIFDETVELTLTLILGVVVLALALTMPLWSLRRRVKREYPNGATLTAWATTAGLGVRTSSRLTCYPWSRLTQVEDGPVLVRCRQSGRRTLAVPAYLPAGPDELARSVEFPIQLIGPVIRGELEVAAAREHTEPSMSGDPIVVDRALRARLVRAWLPAQFGILSWMLPAFFSLVIPFQVAIGAYGMAAFWAVLVLLNLLTWLLSGESRMSGMYAVGATVVGSMGEWLEIQGPWGSVAWHHGWLKQRRMTKHTVTYEVMQINADGSPAQLTDAEKRIVVIPRAFLDTPTPAARAEV